MFDCACDVEFGKNSCCKVCSECMASLTLKPFTALSTCVHLITSHSLHSDPGSAGFPQNIEKTTLKHSQRK